MTDIKNSNANHLLTCGECLSTPSSFTQTICAFYYDFPVTNMIHAVKYQHQRHWIPTLSQALLAKIQENTMLERPDLLIPIPAHQSKIKTRGFNQATLIAAFLAKKLDLSVHKSILQKVCSTKTQTKLTKQERLKNLKGSMTVSQKPSHLKAIVHKHIVLIDDVVTTKATCELASQLLINAGARRVDVWCLARTPKAYFKRSTT